MDVGEPLPFQVEYAKSNRASCKGCKNLISKDTLRLAIMVQSPHFDGQMPNWYHSDCFFKKAKISNHMDIKGLDLIRWDDQEKIKKKIDSGAGSSAGGEKSNNLDDFKVEYSKSSRSKCRVCEDKIETKVIRIAVKDYDSDSARRFGPLDRWHHIDCFAKDKDVIVEDPSSFSIEKVPGFNALKAEDQNDLKSKIKFDVSKKRKANDDSGPKAKKTKADLEFENKLKEQNQLLWEYRDQLEKFVNRQARIGLLEYNDQGVPSGESNVLELLCDAMIFGALNPCPECSGQLRYKSGAYHCTGMATEWAKCLYTTTEPSRKKFTIPKEYMDVEFLAKYKYKPRTRLFPKDVRVTHNSALIVSSAEGGEVSAVRSDKPLAGIKFIVSKGPFTQYKSKTVIENALKEMGATIGTKVDKTTAAVIATAAEVAGVDDGKNAQVAAARKNDVHVVEEGFVSAVAKGGAALLIQSHSICKWGSDPLSRIGQEHGASKSVGPSKSKFVKKNSDSKSQLQKFQVKGGAAVDPESGLSDRTHILQDPATKEPLSTVLNLVDLVRGTNSYYKLQVLKSDTSSDVYVFRAWGRIGTTIGGTKLDHFRSDDSAIQQFRELFLDKTGNDWSDKKSFVKKPHKFAPVELDFGDDEKVEINMSKQISALATPVQQLIQFIFDVDSMKATMLEFEIDLKKMPLGKLSKSQIEKAYTVLTELSNMIDTGGTTTKFLDASTRFYHLIPHDFGMRTPPLLDTQSVIKAKTDMLDNLLEIEVAYNLMKTSGGNNSLDEHYAKLKSEIQPVDPSSDEYKRIVQYITDTHAPTHSNYTLEVQYIFTVDRQGEKERFRPFKKMHNRMLLWHGSRRTNWAGILSQGLRIAPPEAPVTGYMFGKGIYFADMVSKSANYCFTSRSASEGLLLLSEVALGNMAERYNSDTYIKLKPGEHSCKGIGRTHPDTSTFYTSKDKVVYPIGKPVTDNSISSSLLYNEYIVYDVAQAQQKYLLKVDFKYK